VLRAVGAWLKMNGEAIYGTRPWMIYGEGPTRVEAGAFHDTDTQTYTAEDFRFTTKGSILYAIELGRPSASEVVIRSLGIKATYAPKIGSVTLLGAEGPISFQQRPDGLHIQLPTNVPGKYAIAFRIMPATIAK